VRAIEPRFNDPGGWFTCTGTLLSPTVVVTAGHCTFGTGTDGEPTSGGSGGNDGTDRGHKCVGEP
jgi:hypothetical protein